MTTRDSSIGSGLGGPQAEEVPDTLPAVFTDLVCVVMFVVIGRLSHSEGATAAGVAGVAWPFVVGASVGWAAVVAGRRAGRHLPGHGLRTGLTVLAGAVAVGMSLRALTRGAVPVPFVITTTIFLGTLLLGWRGLVALRRRREAARS